jgi:hypothetical protein
MSKTLVAIVTVMAVFAVLYVTAPDGLVDMGTGTQLSGMPREGNGMIGRFGGFLAESTWNPLQFYVMLSALAALSGGLALYWVSIRD